MISWEAMKQVGPDTETGYRAATITFRDAESYKEMSAMGFFVADQEAADIMNREFRQGGAEIDWWSGKVPKGGVVDVSTWYGIDGKKAQPWNMEQGEE
jgi:hypothetical protein